MKIRNLLLYSIAPIGAALVLWSGCERSNSTPAKDHDPAATAQENTDRAPRPAGDIMTIPPSTLALNTDLKAQVVSELGDDPAEWTHFRTALERASTRLDTRSDEELVGAMSEAATPVLREQAIYEYADRHGPAAVAALTTAFAVESDARVRSDLLLAVAKYGGQAARPVIADAVHDGNPEVREWARILHEELGMGAIGFEQRQVQRYAERVFDQSIPLHIDCHLFVKTPDGTWAKMVLSPLKIEEVFGQCHANPHVATREHTLILTKRLQNFYPDGSTHYESFRFKGLTERTDPLTANFAFVANEERPFYKSGQLDDARNGVLDGRVTFLRVGQWKLDPNIRINNDAAIRYVKGNFLSWGYVAYEQLLDDDNKDGDPLDAGEMMRAVVTDRDPPFMNTFVAGTWKGKISDENGDGVLDLDYPPSVTTVDGWLDLDHDGAADRDGITSSAYLRVQDVHNSGRRGAATNVSPVQGRRIIQSDTATGKDNGKVGAAR